VSSFRCVLFAVLLLYGYTFIIFGGVITPDEMVPTYYKYSTVSGYFLQDDPETDPKSFDYMKSNLGLKKRSYDTDTTFPGNRSQWQRFADKLRILNEEAPSGTRYILAYMARHGEGWHNRAERMYGTREWDCKWSTFDGNGQIVWADAHLTIDGISQALAANAFWKRQIVEQSVLLPEKYFVSPLDRCLQTAQLTWTGLDLPQRFPFFPEVKEALRECIGIHTCDRRSSKTYIQSVYPFPTEPGFAEEDPLWLPDLRETPSAMTVRLKELLDDIIRHNSVTVLSLTSHGGAVGAMLRAVGHREFPLQTGAIIPVLLKTELLHGAEPKMPVDPWEPKPDC
jgi:broad specificity phosphatase PhoE